MTTERLKHSIDKPRSDKYTSKQWEEFDKVVDDVFRLRAPTVNKLLELGLKFGGFNGVSKMVLEHEPADDVGEAMIDCDFPLKTSDDPPLFLIRGLPLPFTHADALAKERSSILEMVEAAARSVAETVEKTTLGTQEPFGLSDQHLLKIYGFMNYPHAMECELRLDAKFILDDVKLNSQGSPKQEQA